MKMCWFYLVFQIVLFLVIIQSVVRHLKRVHVYLSWFYGALYDGYYTHIEFCFKNVICSTPMSRMMYFKQKCLVTHDWQYYHESDKKRSWKIFEPAMRNVSLITALIQSISIRPKPGLILDTCAFFRQCENIRFVYCLAWGSGWAQTGHTQQSSIWSMYQKKILFNLTTQRCLMAEVWAVFCGCQRLFWFYGARPPAKPGLLCPYDLVIPSGKVHRASTRRLGVASYV